MLQRMAGENDSARLPRQGAQLGRAVRGREVRLQARKARAGTSSRPSERAEIGRMIRKSKGRRANLTDRERDRLWKLVKKAATG